MREHTCQVCGTTQQEKIYPEGTLKKGDKSNEVKQLQEWLNAHGYDCGAADGIFGKKTEGAIKLVEAELRINQDGIARPVIIGALRPKHGSSEESDYNISRTPAAEDYSDGIDTDISSPYTDVPQRGDLALLVEIASQQFPNKEGDTIEFAWTLTNNTGFKLSNCAIRMSGMFGEQGFVTENDFFIFGTVRRP